MLFVDIVGSTERAVALGDARWRALLDTFYAEVRGAVARFNGWVAKTAGDGVLAVFDAPAAALRGACAIRDTMAAHGVRMRAGVHTGECEIIGDDVTGVAVHIAARIAAAAGPGEVFASATVRDLAAGSGIMLSDRGLHLLKGIPGKQPLVAVEAAAERKRLRAARGMTAHPHRAGTRHRTANAHVGRRG